MNRKLLFIASAVMMVACSNQETFDSKLQQPVQPQASNIRSFEEALQIAQSSIEMVDGQAKTRAASPRKIAINDAKICKLDAKTRSTSYMNDTLMYVFNFEDNQGFSVVSANRNTDPLIAVTESGYYDPDSLSEIEGFNLFMDMAKEYVGISRGPILDPIICQKDSVVYSHSYVGPFVNVMWGQSHPEGEFCPNGVAGCSNIAVAQIMSYYETPASITLTYEGADKPVQSLNWHDMKQHLTGDNFAMCMDTTSHYAIARLCRQLGELAGSTYNQATDTTSANTSTYRENLRTALQNLGWYTGSWTSYSQSNVNTFLNNNYPLLIRGTRVLGNGKRSGHMWVLDGFDNLQTTTYIFEQVLGSIIWELVDVRVSNERLYHFNWGWYGKNNGYFAANVFNAASVLFPDTPNNTAINNYTESIMTLTAYPN